MTEEVKEYPEFFREHLRDKINEYNNCRKNSIDTVGFVFITDVHIHLNGRASVPLILEIGSKTDVDTVLCGGDHCWAFGSKAQCLADFQDSLHYMDPIRANMNLYHARGNHDATVRSSMELNTGYTMPYMQLHQEFYKHTSRVNGSVDGKLYYYADDLEKKLRYVVLDTSEEQDAENTAWGVRNGMCDEQLKWLAQKAMQLPENDWSVVIMGHIPCTKEIPSYSPELDDLRLVLEAFKNRTACKYTDFKDANGELVAYLCGHNHKDASAVVNGVLHISTGCDSYCKDDVFARNVGKYENTLFDLFLLDKNLRVLQVFRIGAGKSRSFNY